MTAPAISAPALNGRLGNGQLRRQVAEWLAARPGPHAVGEIAKDLGRSAGAVANALTTLADRAEAARLPGTAGRAAAGHPASLASAAGVPKAPAPKTAPGPVTRPGGQVYRPRVLTGMADVEALRTLRAEGVPSLLAGPPGTGKMSLVEAAFPSGCLVIWIAPSDTASTMTGALVVILADPAATSQAVARAVTASAHTA